MKHFANDWFETFPHWSLYFPFPGCHCETLWQWLFWNNSTWITLLPFLGCHWSTLTMIVLKHFHIDHCYPFLGCHCETLWQWLFWNISTLITLLPFFRLSLWNTLTFFETFPQWSLCYPFLGCHCEALWQWLFWNISTWSLCYSFLGCHLWNTLTMTILTHFHNDHFAFLFLGCHFETLWQWLFWNISTVITLLPFLMLSLWNTLTMTVLKTFPQWSLCYPFLGCRCETLWQWLFWNISTLITLLPF